MRLLRVMHGQRPICFASCWVALLRLSPQVVTDDVLTESPATSAARRDFLCNFRLFCKVLNYAHRSRRLDEAHTRAGVLDAQTNKILERSAIADVE